MRISLGTPNELHSVVRRNWTALVVLGGIASLLIGIYSDQARTVIEWIWAHTAVFVLVVIAVATLVSVTWHARGVRDAKRSIRQPILPKSLDIRAADFDDDLPSDQAVFGRQLHYLERPAESDTIVVLLHGIGLDADDFKPYMNIATDHTIAITLFGFNAAEARDPHYRPIGLTTHAELVNGALNNIRRQHENKKMLLVGFSTGADMILKLGEMWKAHPSRKPDPAGLLLLDPNINHSSMIISGCFATMDPQHPLPEFKRIVQRVSTLTEFENITEYLHKISTKDAAQIQHHAKDWWEYWEPDGQYGKFFARVDNLRNACSHVKIFFSVHFEDHFNELVAMARPRGLQPMFDLLREDHFELINDDFLSHQVATLAGRNVTLLP